MPKNNKKRNKKQFNNNKNINKFNTTVITELGNALACDINNEPANLNDIETLDTRNLQYNSPIVDAFMSDGLIEDVCDTIRMIKFADKSDAFICEILKKSYPSYCGRLTVPTFKKWVNRYPDIREAYGWNRDMVLGKLVSKTMNIAIKTDDAKTLSGLIDKVDDGRLSPKNKIDKTEEIKGSSPETNKTVSKLFEELNDIEEPEDLDKEDSGELGGVNSGV